MKPPWGASSTGNEGYTPPQIHINKNPGMANIENEIIDVKIIFLLALLINKYNKYEIGRKKRACLA